jgi:hypothetical protein
MGNKKIKKIEEEKKFDFKKLLIVSVVFLLVLGLYSGNFIVFAQQSTSEIFQTMTGSTNLEGSSGTYPAGTDGQTYNIDIIGSGVNTSGSNTGSVTPSQTGSATQYNAYTQQQIKKQKEDHCSSIRSKRQCEKTSFCVLVQPGGVGEWWCAYSAKKDKNPYALPSGEPQNNAIDQAVADALAKKEARESALAKQQALEKERELSAHEAYDEMLRKQKEQEEAEAKRKKDLEDALEKNRLDIEKGKKEREAMTPMKRAELIQREDAFEKAKENKEAAEKAAREARIEAENALNGKSPEDSSRDKFTDALEKQYQAKLADMALERATEAAKQAGIAVSKTKEAAKARAQSDEWGVDGGDENVGVLKEQAEKAFIASKAAGQQATDYSIRSQYGNEKEGQDAVLKAENEAQKADRARSARLAKKREELFGVGDIKAESIADRQEGQDAFLKETGERNALQAEFRGTWGGRFSEGFYSGGDSKIISTIENIGNSISNTWNNITKSFSSQNPALPDNWSN